MGRRIIFTICIVLCIKGEYWSVHAALVPCGFAFLPFLQPDSGVRMTDDEQKGFVMTPGNIVAGMMGVILILGLIIATAVAVARVIALAI